METVTTLTKETIIENFKNWVKDLTFVFDGVLDNVDDMTNDFEICIKKDEFDNWYYDLPVWFESVESSFSNELDELEVENFGDLLDYFEIYDNVRDLYNEKAKNLIDTWISKFSEEKEKEGFISNEYYDFDGDTIVEFKKKLPSDAEEIAYWDNQSPNCLSESDFHFIWVKFYYSTENDEYYVERSAYEGNAFGSNSRCTHIKKLSDYEYSCSIDDIEIYDENHREYLEENLIK